MTWLRNLLPVDGAGARSWTGYNCPARVGDHRCDEAADQAHWQHTCGCGFRFAGVVEQVTA